MARVSLRFAGEPADANRASESVERGLEGVSRQAVKTRASLNTVWGDRQQVDLYSKSINGLNVGLGNTTHQTKLFSGSLGVIKWPAIYTGASLAAQGIGALGAGMVALTAAVAPAAGALGALPAALTTVQQVSGTLKLALRGLEEGIDGDTEALAKLSPAARAFAGIVRGTLTPALDGLSRIASQRIFKPLLDEIRPMIDTYLPLLQKVVGDTATEIGRFAEKLAQQLRGDQWTKAFAELGELNVRVIHNLGQAALTALPAIRSLTMAFAPLVEWSSKLAISFSEWLSASVAANRANGDLDRSVSRVKETLSTLGSILKNVASGFWEIGKAASPLGNEILRDLERVTAEFAAWTKSLEGQTTLRKYFDDAKPALYEVAALMRDLTATFFRISTDEGFTDLVRMLRVELLPILEEVIRKTSAAFGPALIQLLESVGRLFLSIAGSSGPLVAFVEGLTRIASGLNRMLESVPGLKGMVVTMAGLAGTLKALSFAAAITGARSLATSLGLIGPAAARSAATTTGSMGVIGASAIVATGRVATLRAALAGIATKIGIGITIGVLLDQYAGDTLDRIENVLRGQVDRIIPGDIFDLPRIGGQGGPQGPGTNDRVGNDTRGKGTGVSTTAAVQVPTSHRSTHPTTNLSGFPAVDYFAKAGTAVLAPEDGQITRISGSEPNTGNPGFNGYSVYFVGSQTGNTYFITHLINPSSIGYYVKDAVLGFVASGTAGGPHAHVGIKKPAGSPTAVPSGGGGGTTGGGTSAAAPPSKAQTALQKAIGGLKEQAASLTDDIPEIAKVLTPRLEALYDQLGDGRLSEKALAGIRAAGEKLRHALQNLIKGDELRDRIPNLRGTINSILDDESREGLQKRANQLEQLWRKIVRDGLTDKELATFKAATQKLNAAVNEAFSEDTLERVKGFRGQLNELFAKGFIDEKSLEMARAALDRIPAMLKRFIANDGILGPQEKAAIRKQLSIAQEIIDAGNEAMREAEKAFARVRKTFSDLARDGVISDADLAVLSKAVAGIGGAIGVGLQEAVAAVETGRQDFDRAWGDLRTAIERAFQEQVIGKFQLTLDFASVYEQTALGEAALASATEKWNAVISSGMDAGAEAVRAAVERVLTANREYTAAIISQDQDRIKRAIDERIAANAALTNLAASGISEQAQAVLTAGQELISATQTIGASQVAEQKRLWEESKTVALAGVLKVVDEVGTQLRNGEISWAAAVGKIGVALTRAGMDAGSAADLLGQNIAAAMGTAAAAVERAVAALTVAINRLVAIMGGAVGQAAGNVASMEALYLRLRSIAGASEAEAMRIANAAAAAGIARAPAAAPGPSNSTARPPVTLPGPGVSPVSGLLPRSPSPAPPQPAPYVPPPATPPGYYEPPQPITNPIPGAPIRAFAEGGVAMRRVMAHVGERFPEAMIPMPPTMDPGVRRFLIGLAKGGWRAQSRGTTPRPGPIMARTGGGGGDLGRGGESGGARIVNLHVNVTAPVSAGLVTSERDLGDEIARIATEKIATEMNRIAGRNAVGKVLN